MDVRARTHTHTVKLQHGSEIGLQKKRKENAAANKLNIKSQTMIITKPKKWK